MRENKDNPRTPEEQESMLDALERVFRKVGLKSTRPVKEDEEKKDD